MLEPRAICETCGHTRDWHDRDAVRARHRSDPPIERPCHREVGGVACPCGGFIESGAVAASETGAARHAAPAFELVRVAALVLLVVVLGLGLLYAYRSQAPSVPEVDLTRALQDISAGRVRLVSVAGSTATLEFRDSPTHREQATLPQSDPLLARAVSDHNAANPSQATELRYVQDGPAVGVVGPIILSLLPVLVIGGFFYYTMRTRRGS